MSLQENAKITEFIWPPWYDVETAQSTFMGRSCQKLWLCIFAVERLFIQKWDSDGFPKKSVIEADVLARRRLYVLLATAAGRWCLLAEQGGSQFACC